MDIYIHGSALAQSKGACLGGLPVQARAQITGRPHFSTTTVSQQLLLFSDHSLHAAWLIIHLLRAM